MIEVDFHVHSFFSNCGMHTHLEILRQAALMGMKAVAITDHGPALHGRRSRTLYDRLHDPVPGIRFLKGMECNVTDARGAIDLPANELEFMDIVLVGLHPNLDNGFSVETYTDMLVRAIQDNPCIDIVAHPNDAVYEVAFEPLAEAAREHGVALELNNSKTALGRIGDDVTMRLVETCKRVGCCMAVNSDTHAINELGRDDAVRPFLESCAFPSELLVNRNAAAAFAFVGGNAARLLQNKRSGGFEKYRYLLVLEQERLYHLMTGFISFNSNKYE